MAALTPTLVKAYDLGGGTSQLKVFTVTPEANGDTVDLSGHFSAIDHVDANISGGMDAALSIVQAVESSLTVTLTELEQDGTAATDWTGAEITIRAYGQAEGV